MLSRRGREEREGLRSRMSADWWKGSPREEFHPIERSEEERMSFSTLVLFEM